MRLIAFVLFAALSAVSVEAAMAAPAALRPKQAATPAAFKDRLRVAQARLALDVVGQLSRAGKPMAVASPASLAAAAAALDLGASAELRSALHRVLGFRQVSDVSGDLASLRQTVQRLKKPVQGEGPLRAASFVVFDKGLELYPGVSLAFEQAGIDELVLDLSSPKASEDVNQRVRQQTSGLIPALLGRNTSGASLLVLNGLHFKDRWKVPFDRAETRPMLFKRVAGAPVSVSTMHLPQGSYRFRQDARFVGIDLPYGSERFSMTVVTTRGERPASAQGFTAASNWLAGDGFAPAQGELALPLLNVSSQEDLTPVLDALGLRQTRLAPDALSGFSATPAAVARVVQRVEMRVNEEGTEAAAATAVAVERGVEAGYVRMIVDKPFLFALRDAESGLILVAGYVSQPQALATAAQ